MTQAREVLSVEAKFRLLEKKTKRRTSTVVFSEMLPYLWQVQGEWWRGRV